MSFKNWSSKQKELNKPKVMPIPTAYQKILDEFPTIAKVDFTVQPAHNIVHDIDTGNNKPCKAKARPLMPNAPKTIKGHKAWQDLISLGIIEAVDHKRKYHMV